MSQEAYGLIIVGAGAADGLPVIDGLIRPNITSGNTNAPTQALARHGAGMLVEDLKRDLRSSGASRRGPG
jgi:choline dehydrogenase-like flavoprotein